LTVSRMGAGSFQQPEIRKAAGQGMTRRRRSVVRAFVRSMVAAQASLGVPVFHTANSHSGRVAPRPTRGTSAFRPAGLPRFPRPYRMTLCLPDDRSWSRP
jgi:hypothetical protein